MAGYGTWNVPTTLQSECHWALAWGVKSFDLCAGISFETEFCVTTGRNVPTTQFNLAKKWLAKQMGNVARLEKVPDIDLAEIRIERSYRFCGL